MPMYDYKFEFEDTTDLMAAASTNSTNEINFGVTNPNIGRGSQAVGAHIVITTAYTDVNQGCDIWIMNGASSAGTKLCCRRLTKVELAAAGGHYFIPLVPTNLQYVKLKAIPVSTTSTAGELTAWLGPRTGGET